MVAPSTGDAGNVIVTAADVVLHLTKSFTAAVYADVVIAVTCNPVTIVDHDALDPSVVKYFPLLLVCVGNVIGGADDTHVVPLLVSKLPEVPGATACNALVPFPNNTLLAVNVVEPVPPLATANVALSPAAVPEVS